MTIPVTKANIISETLGFIKTDFLTNITDPLSSRKSNSKFILTSYPQRDVEYPIITLKCIDLKAKRAGMQTTAQDITIKMEIRIWARNEKEKDTLYNSILNELANIQFTASTGSVANNLHDLDILDSVEFDEEGEQGIKNRIIHVNYHFYNVI